jgi:hypothetical protein
MEGKQNERIEIREQRKKGRARQKKDNVYCYIL